MNVLIVQSNPALASLWARHLERQGNTVHIAHSESRAVALLQDTAFQAIVLDLVLQDGNALNVADYANYRQPDTPVIFVTNSSFFSDGSIFRHCANACAFVPSATPPDDLAAMVEHYATQP